MVVRVGCALGSHCCGYLEKVLVWGEGRLGVSSEQGSGDVLEKGEILL